MTDQPKEAMLYHRVAQSDDLAVVCDLCHRRCRIPEGDVGICRARRNQGGRLGSLVYGRCWSHKPTPIERKPLYHFLPGTQTMSYNTVGCNFVCEFCQNSKGSQWLRENPGSEPPGDWTKPEEIVDAAERNDCPSVTATWTEPTIFFEYALEIARLAHERGIANCWVSNGFMTPEAVVVIAPYLDAINVDLKSFNPETYRKTIGGKLDGVLETLPRLHEKGVWLEVATLVVPGMNDSADELRAIARFLAGLSPDIPWVIEGFVPHHKMEDKDCTPVEAIHLARDIGREEGLRYVFTEKGGDPDPSRSTFCRQCEALLIERNPIPGPRFKTIHLGPDGVCPSCGTNCPGVWKNPAT